MLIVAMVAVIVVYVQKRLEMTRRKEEEMSARMDIHKDMRKSRMIGGFLRRCRKALWNEMQASRLTLSNDYKASAGCEMFAA